MREDPLISGGIRKFLLAVVLLGVLGFGGWQLIKDIDLPDLETADVTNLQDTTLQDTTIGVPEKVKIDSPGAVQPEPIDTFSASGFGAAVRAVRSAAGERAQLTEIVVNDVQIQFIVRSSGDAIHAYSYIASSGALQRQDATITISGNATLDDFSFPLAVIKPAWMERLVRGSRKLSGKPGYQPTVYTLERAIPFGRRELEWTLNGQAGGRYVLYRAAANGTNFTDPGGEGTPIPQAALDAQALQECVAAAGSDPELISDCLD